MRPHRALPQAARDPRPRGGGVHRRLLRRERLRRHQHQRPRRIEPLRRLHERVPVHVRQEMRPHPRVRPPDRQRLRRHPGPEVRPPDPDRQHIGEHLPRRPTLRPRMHRLHEPAHLLAFHRRERRGVLGPPRHRRQQARPGRRAQRHVHHRPMLGRVHRLPREQPPPEPIEPRDRRQPEQRGQRGVVDRRLRPVQPQIPRPRPEPLGPPWIGGEQRRDQPAPRALAQRAQRREGRSAVRERYCLGHAAVLAGCFLPPPYHVPPAGQRPARTIRHATRATGVARRRPGL